jgi:hypothetical protein
VTFPIPLSTGLDENHVYFIPAETSPPTPCPGTASAPAAAPGNLCVYENAGYVTEVAIEKQSLTKDNGGTDPYGFDIFFENTIKTGSYGLGTWALTAP